MNSKQKFEAANLLAGWLEKLSVGCLVVGLFQPAHILGGIAAAVFCFTAGLILKIRSVR